MFFLHDEIVPCVEIYDTGPIARNRILQAYKDLRNMIHGVADVVYILDSIEEGIYSLGEATIAGLIITEGVKGAIMDWLCKGTLLCVNGYDLLAFDDAILSNEDFNYQRFSPDTTSEIYLLEPLEEKQRKIAKKEQQKQAKKEAAATANSNRPRKTSNAPKSPKV